MSVLVVGSGIAGLTAALRLAGRTEVLLVSKGALADGATARAQGGIAAAIDPADSPAAHAADTLAAGGGLGDPAAIRLLCEAAPSVIAELADKGVVFDAGLGLEGAHSRHRILHAGGDATGAAIQAALQSALADRVEVREHTVLVDLVVRAGRVVGAVLLGPDGVLVEQRADAVLLATGGAGQLFSRTTNPLTATGDGVAAAARAGAVLADLDRVQFHPTATPGAHLVSEAVRGEGAVLRDARGERFVDELAARDVVARAMARTMAAQDGAPVLLDATALGADFLAARFPTIDAAVRAEGLDWGREPIPVTPAAHYWMGGIRTDLDGRTSLPGLLAAGECACTGVHGANRLASNSLLEGAVFGARAAESALATPRSSASPPGPSSPPRESGTDPAWTRRALQEEMWSHAGPLRSGEGRPRLPDWVAPDPTDRRSVEDRNLLLLGRLLLAAARRPARLEAPAC
ncbi:L-aspartate oxidase [Brachybacterium sp. J153]|uniref:L-aspartate oxidase n=1 Tax=Brachybacterium sp. J153 TaxID=3116488 RepID=UPI002E75E4E8|nr:FAD-binding protein [Brachybacterium sp. J153]MEE1619571.1 FAD-binding protein [Brachybacterium sp. J153]